MKVAQALTALLGGGASVVKSASSIALIVGGIYLADCRISAKGADAIDRCYFTALPLMGVGIAGRGGFAAGYSTYNPALRRPEDELTPEPPSGGSRRDGKGRFTGSH